MCWWISTINFTICTSVFDSSLVHHFVTQFFHFTKVYLTHPLKIFLVDNYLFFSFSSYNRKLGTFGTYTRYQYSLLLSLLSTCIKMVVIWTHPLNSVLWDCSFSPGFQPYSRIIFTRLSIPRNSLQQVMFGPSVTYSDTHHAQRLLTSVFGTEVVAPIKKQLLLFWNWRKSLDKNTSL